MPARPQKARRVRQKHEGDRSASRQVVKREMRERKRGPDRKETGDLYETDMQIGGSELRYALLLPDTDQKVQPSARLQIKRTLQHFPASKPRHCCEEPPERNQSLPPLFKIH